MSAVHDAWPQYMSAVLDACCMAPVHVRVALYHGHELSNLSATTHGATHRTDVVCPLYIRTVLDVPLVHKGSTWCVSQAQMSSTWCVPCILEQYLVCVPSI
jgi:hypothetical protein